jgi:hypothetical protein
MRHVIQISWTIGVAIVFLVLTIYGENNWLADRVMPTAGTKVPQWIDNFQQWAIAGIAGSLMVSLLWYVLGQWGFRFNRWGRSYRPIWGLLLILPAILAVLGCLFTKQTIEGSTWAYGFYFLNNILTFYVGTVLFSAAPVMYVPVGSEYLRPWQVRKR